VLRRVKQFGPRELVVSGGAGADAFTIADILGHASIQMSARDTHATDQGRRRARAAILTEREKDCHQGAETGRVTSH